MFEGFPDEQRAFFAAVARHTTWEAVSARVELHRRAIYRPMSLLVEELEDEFGSAKVYRLHRSPRYWVEQWAYAPVVDTIAFGFRCPSMVCGLREDGFAARPTRLPATGVRSIRTWRRWSESYARRASNF